MPATAVALAALLVANAGSGCTFLGAAIGASVTQMSAPTNVNPAKDNAAAVIHPNDVCTLQLISRPAMAGTVVEVRDREVILRQEEAPLTFTLDQVNTMSCKHRDGTYVGLGLAVGLIIDVVAIFFAVKVGATFRHS